MSRRSDSIHSGLMSVAARPRATTQLRALLWKQGIVYRRAWCTPCLLVLFLPAAVLLVGLLITSATSGSNSTEPPLPPTQPITVGTTFGAFE